MATEESLRRFDQVKGFTPKDLTGHGKDLCGTEHLSAEIRLETSRSRTQSGPEFGPGFM